MNKVVVIAEAGVNHNGSFDMAMQLVQAAAAAGADYVKFQTFKADRLVSASADKAEYQKANDGDGSQLSMLRKLELSARQFMALADECHRLGIGFLSTPFDEESVDMLAPIGMDYWKIPSGEITNLPLLRKVGALNGKIILSTGMSTLDEVEAAVLALETAGTPRNNIILLHCTTQYPAPYRSVNLCAMDDLASLGCGGVGYSDHTEGIVVPVAAVARGAVVIEKHFTLDRNLPGPDHRASLEPDMLARMVHDIHLVSLTLGQGGKYVADAERSNITVARKSIVAARPIMKGEILSEENLATKRPATGLSPMTWDSVIGTVAVRDFGTDEPISLQ